MKESVCIENTNQRFFPHFENWLVAIKAPICMSMVFPHLSLRCQQYFMAASFIGMGSHSIWRKLYRPTESHFVIHAFSCIEYTYKMYLDVERCWMIWLWIWYLMPISTICQLYVGGQFYWWRKPEDPGKPRPVASHW